MSIFLKTTKRNRTFFSNKALKRRTQADKTRGFFVLGLVNL